MDFSGVLPGLIGALASAATFGLAAWVFPSSRWTRQLKRDIEILGGLPPGPERDRWQAKIVVLARRLRAYEKFVPMWQRVAPFVVALYTGALVGGTIALPEVRDALFEEVPIVILGIGSLIGVSGFLYVAIRGGDLRGRDPDFLLKAEEEQVPEEGI
jgi:hypothetical protein